MKTQYTPGPWLFNVSTPKEESAKWGGNCGAKASVYRKTGKKLLGVDVTDTIVFLPHWRNDSDNEEHTANARLIAAAPELLEALQGMIAFYHTIEENEELIDGVDKQRYTAAIKAIAKATGNQ